MSVPFPIAVPTPRFVFTRLGCEHLYHLTGFAALENGIVRRLTGRRGEWADCDVTLLAASGFDPSLRKLFRDYSIVDVELGMKDRGRYTYFFCRRADELGNLQEYRSKPMGPFQHRPRQEIP